MEFSHEHARKVQQAHDHASSALDRYASVNGQLMALEKKVRDLEKVLEMAQVFGGKPDAETHERITKLESRAGKHLSHIKAHRSRIDALEGGQKPSRSSAATSSVPKIRVPNTTLAKATARPVIQTRPVLNARDLLAKADAQLSGSDFMHAEHLVRHGKLEDADEFMEKTAKEKRGNQLLERAKRVPGLPQKQRDFVIQAIRDGHHDHAQTFLDGRDAQGKLEARPGSGARRV